MLEPFVVVGAAAHSIEILRDHGVVIIRQSKPVQVNRTKVAGVGSHGETDLRAAAAAETGRGPKDPRRSRLAPGPIRSRVSARQDVRDYLTITRYWVTSIGLNVVETEIAPITFPA